MIGEPITVGRVLAGTCPCGAPAVATYTARSESLYRSVNTCGPCEPKARAWIARAGPPVRTTIRDEQEPYTLF